MDNAQTAIALLDAARWIWRHEDDDTSYSVNVSYSGLEITSYLSNVEEMASTRKAIGGKWNKDTTEYYFKLKQIISDNLTVVLAVPREAACEPKVVGQETIEVKDYDNCPTKTITRDIVEYDCKPILS